jgi:serine/threonine protein kinase
VAREAQAMAQLSDPNVVAVYDVDAVGARLFVAMELVHGPTLAAWIAEGPHPWRKVVDAFAQAGRGLAAAHEAGIIHRDFKPNNVILGDRVRVADFGLARLGDRDEPAGAPSTRLLATSVTHTGQPLGTRPTWLPSSEPVAPSPRRPISTRSASRSRKPSPAPLRRGSSPG